MPVHQRVDWVLLHLTTSLKIPALLGELRAVSRAVALRPL